MNKDEKIGLIALITFILLTSIIIIIAIVDSCQNRSKDIEAYNQCMKTYNDSRTCDKLIYGVYR